MSDKAKREFILKSNTANCIVKIEIPSDAHLHQAPLFRLVIDQVFFTFAFRGHCSRMAIF